MRGTGWASGTLAICIVLATPASATVCGGSPWDDVLLPSGGSVNVPGYFTRGDPRYGPVPSRICGDFGVVPPSLIVAGDWVETGRIVSGYYETEAFK
jgi:hypothetical protein